MAEQLRRLAGSFLGYRTQHRDRPENQFVGLWGPCPCPLCIDQKVRRRPMPSFQCSGIARCQNCWIVSLPLELELAAHDSPDQPESQQLKNPRPELVAKAISSKTDCHTKLPLVLATDKAGDGTASCEPGDGRASKTRWCPLMGAAGPRTELNPFSSFAFRIAHSP